MLRVSSNNMTTLRKWFLFIFIVSISCIFLVFIDSYWYGSYYGFVLLQSFLEGLIEDKSEESHVLFWKLKKVGGSGICSMLRCQAEVQALTIATHDNFSPGDYISPMEQINSLHYNIMCIHEAAKVLWPYYWANHPQANFTQFVILRHPLDQAVSYFYERCQEDVFFGDDAPCPKDSERKHISAHAPSSQLAQDWFEWYITTDRWLAEWGFIRSLDHAEYVLNVLLMSHNVQNENIDQIIDQGKAFRNLIVLVYDEYDASLDLIAQTLHVPQICRDELERLEAEKWSTVEQINRYRHLTAVDWPEEVITSFLARSETKQMILIYEKAQKIFSKQVGQSI